MKGYLCHIPFNYAGKFWKRCVRRYPGDRPWCPISVNDEQEPVVTDFCYNDYGKFMI